MNLLNLTPKESLDRCREICKNSEAFYEVTGQIQGYNYYMFNYRLASYSDFKDNSATELRGLTFIEDSNGDISRHIALHKFHNINETIDYMYDDIKDKKVTSCQEKADGSLITFIKLPNGNIIPKTKMSFDNPQIDLARECYKKDSNLREFIDLCMENKQTPIFEIISPFNLIVVPYQNTELLLLQIRSEYGEYNSKEVLEYLVDDFNISSVRFFDYTLDELIQLQETQKGIEGWVVTLENSQIIKLKTKDYFEKHGLMSPNNLRDNLLIQSILSGSIDDIISILPEGQKKDYILDVTERIQNKFNHLVIDYKKLHRKFFEEFNQDKRSFAIQNNTHELFSGVVKKLNIQPDVIEDSAEELVKEFILRKTQKLSDAVEFLKGI